MFKNETTKTNQDPLPNQGPASAGAAGSTSKAPKTYTEEEVRILTEKTRSDVLAEAGRKYKPIEDENATLKSQLANNQTLIKDVEGKIVRLQQEIEDLGEDDPDKKRLIKRLADLDETERKLKADRQALETERTTHSERIKKAEKFERDETIKSVITDYEGIPLEKMTVLCDKLNLTTKEQITAAAETIGNKIQTAQDTKPAIHADSGVTNGAGVDTEKLSSHEKIMHGLKQKK